MKKLKELQKIEQELFDKVWWNRHMVYRDKVERGLEALTLPPKEWIKIQQKADDMVDKYGEDQLLLDDFEWGMLNGRLAMIRWVLGDEWSNLDT